jgi:methylglutaconyl-CoA hydratase
VKAQVLFITLHLMNFGCFNESEGTEFSLDLHLINAMRSCSKLIVGRIHGKAVGGVGIASACDYAMATKNASIKLSELAMELVPL